MPRKPRLSKQRITVIINEVPIALTLTPPNGRRKSWFVYWPGLLSSRSTGTPILDDAIRVSERLLCNGGQRNDLEVACLTDDEFKKLQRAHFGRITDGKAKTRAEKSLTACLEAIDAFKEITGLDTVAMASPDDCAAFQRRALEKPKNWRMQHPRSKKEGVKTLSPNTVDKWTRSLQAAFERANINAGKKCVRGVVDEGKLLVRNPWHHFTWVEKRKKPIRQLSDDELTSLLDYFETSWRGVPIASTAIKVLFWTWTRLSELTSIRWDDLRCVDGEHHFEIIGKWGVEKWARLPNTLFNQLESMRVAGSPFVFAAYNSQLRSHHLANEKTAFANRVCADFNPQAFGDWLQARIPEWAESTGKEHAYPHAIRKTALQRARIGEDINRQVAEDARLGADVMLESYVIEGGEQHRQASNRTFRRLVKSLPEQVAFRFGYERPKIEETVEARLRDALEQGDWSKVAILSAELARRPNR